MTNVFAIINHTTVLGMSHMHNACLLLAATSLITLPLSLVIWFIIPVVDNVPFQPNYGLGNINKIKMQLSRAKAYISRLVFNIKANKTSCLF